MLPTEGLTKFMSMLGTLLACNKFVGNILSALKSVKPYRPVELLCSIVWRSSLCEVERQDGYCTSLIRAVQGRKVIIACAISTNGCGVQPSCVVMARDNCCRQFARVH